MSSSVKAALTANGLVTVAKVIGATVTGSASMLAEAIHSGVDCANQLLLLFGSKQALKRETKDHPFGYGKEVYFWSFLVAILLFSLGGLFSIYEGWHKLHDTTPVQNVGWAYGILIFAILMEGRSLGVCLKEIRAKYPGKTLRWFFKETRDTDLLVILGEDAAALFGLVIATLCLTLAVVTGNPMWDALGSLLVGVLLCVVAVGLFVEIKALLIGQSVAPDTRKRLYSFLAKRPEIEHTYECMTMQMGPEALVTIRARMREVECAQKLIADINVVEHALKQEFPEFSWICFEPDNVLDAE